LLQTYVIEQWRSQKFSTVCSIPSYPSISAAVPSWPYYQKTLWYESPVWTAARHWVPASVSK